MPDYDPKMCCDGFECGCMGQPTEPPVCSKECYDKEFGGENRTPTKILALQSGGLLPSNEDI